MKKRTLIFTIAIGIALAITSVIWYQVGEFIHVLGRMS